MPSSDAAADDEAQEELARRARVEQVVEELRRRSVDTVAYDVALPVDLLIEARIERALYIVSPSAARMRHGSNMDPDPHLAQLEERCEAARINLRRILHYLGVGA
jgi:hypothetical protein